MRQEDSVICSLLKMISAKHIDEAVDVASAGAGALGTEEKGVSDWSGLEGISPLPSNFFAACSQHVITLPRSWSICS